MTIRNFQFLLRPRSVALIGASTRPGSVGLITARNLLAGGFAGPIWLVNPKYGSIEGHDCCPSVAALPAAPDLASIVTPPITLPPPYSGSGGKALGNYLDARRGQVRP
jgi:acetyltransferase